MPSQKSIRSLFDNIDIQKIKNLIRDSTREKRTQIVAAVRPGQSVFANAKTIVHKATFVYLLFATVGCNKILHAPIPDSQLDPDAVFSHNATARAAMDAVYAQMSAEQVSFRISLLSGLSADELRDYSGKPEYLEFEHNRLTPSNPLLAQLWENLYHYLYECNAVIEGLGSNTAVTDSLRMQLTGEAKCVRAFLYFYLVNLFGDVPLILGTDYRQSSVASRTPTDSVYAHVRRDLHDAAELIPTYTRTPGTPRVRPTRDAVLALLARVALFTGDWQTAIDHATTVLNGGIEQLCDSLPQIFWASSAEAVWQLAPTSPSQISSEGANFFLTAYPGQVALDSLFAASFEPGDARRQHWVGSLYANGQNIFFPKKYHAAPDSIKEYSVVIRLSELMLIRAEAEAHLERLTAAAADLNNLRRRAVLPPIPLRSLGDALSAVARERRSELFTEWGHRWLDLKRTNAIANMPRSKDSPWRPTAASFPIPQAELDHDLNLVQNPGY